MRFLHTSNAARCVILDQWVPGSRPRVLKCKLRGRKIILQKHLAWSRGVFGIIKV
jgi:hypothetical protein